MTDEELDSLVRNHPHGKQFILRCSHAIGYSLFHRVTHETCTLGPIDLISSLHVNHAMSAIRLTLPRAEAITANLFNQLREAKDDINNLLNAADGFGNFSKISQVAQEADLKRMKLKRVSVWIDAEVKRIPKMTAEHLTP